MALISLDQVTKIYPRGSRPALDNISLDIDRGEFVFLVGASGSGKTSLLRLLLHEEQATEGEVRVAGNDLRRLTNRQVPHYRRSIGFVFQDYKLLANKTVWENVAFALEVIGTKRATIRTLVPQVLETVGLTGKEDRRPQELSGGEQQRVAIARAYVNHPGILLADEPTGNLDPTTSVGIMEVLEAINRTGTTIVMATHNEEIVNSMRKRVIELHAGKIVRDERNGSYDSQRYFPDAEVEANAQRVIGIDHNLRKQVLADANIAQGISQTTYDHDAQFRRDGGEREVTGSIEAVAHAAQLVQDDEGIARLAKSVHSGRTGRYGEAFANVEDTLTWGKGLHLEDLAQQEASNQAQQVQQAQQESNIPAPPAPPAPPAASQQHEASHDSHESTSGITDEVTAESTSESAAENTAEQHGAHNQDKPAESVETASVEENSTQTAQDPEVTAKEAAPVQEEAAVVQEKATPTQKEATPEQTTVKPEQVKADEE